MKFKLKKWKELSLLGKAGRLFDFALLGIMSLHLSFYVDARSYSNDFAKRVYVIESHILFKILYPLSGSAIGISFPVLNLGYVSRHRVNEEGTDLQGVIAHEAKHLEQFSRMSLIDLLIIDDWKLEGVAEYSRGESTLELCGDGDAGTERQKSTGKIMSWLNT